MSKAEKVVHIVTALVFHLWIGHIYFDAETDRCFALFGASLVWGCVSAGFVVRRWAKAFHDYD